jgi:hypothetical protein
VTNVLGQLLRKAPGRPLIGLVGCVKKKAEHNSAARDLYMSPLFRGRRAAIEGRTDKWFILSAEHGLVEPDQRIEPYDASLAQFSVKQRRDWASGVLASLQRKLGDFSDYTFEIHAGRNYFAYGLRDGLLQAGAQVVIPTEGLRQGEQLRHYAGSEVRPHRDARTVGRQAQVHSPYAAIGQLLEGATDDELTLTLAQVERLIQRPLPPSARRYPAWWHSTANAPGWRVSPRLGEGTVLFRRRATRPP